MSARPLAPVPRADTGAIGAELRRRLPLPHRITTMAADDDGMNLLGADASPLDRMVIALTRLQERQTAIARSTEAARVEAADAHREVIARLDTFVPRVEIEAKHAALTARIDGLAERVTVIEGRAWKAIAWVLGVVGTGVAGLFGLHVKGG